MDGGAAEATNTKSSDDFHDSDDDGGSSGSHKISDIVRREFLCAINNRRVECGRDKQQKPPEKDIN